MKQHLVAITLCSLIFGDVSAADQTQITEQEKPLTYNPLETQRLQALFNKTCDSNYSLHSLAFEDFVNNGGANPGLEACGRSLLSEAVMKNDYRLTETLLAHKADPNTSEFFPPLHCACQEPIAQLLIDNKADLQVRNTLNQDLLGNSLKSHLPEQMIVFWLNAGFSPNQPDLHGSLLHRLFEGTTQEVMRKAAPFLWHYIDLSKRNYYNQTAIDILKKKSPELVPQFKALTRVIPQIRREQENLLLSWLVHRLTNDLTTVVMQYEPRIGYCDNDWPAIERRVLANVEDEKKGIKKEAPKRTRSQSLKRSNKRR